MRCTQSIAQWNDRSETAGKVRYPSRLLLYLHSPLQPHLVHGVAHVDGHGVLRPGLVPLGEELQQQGVVPEGTLSQGLLPLSTSSTPARTSGSQITPSSHIRHMEYTILYDISA